MKGVSLAIETIIYLILAVLVLMVLIGFFLTQAGPAQDQYALEAKRNSLCGAYVTNDFSCAGTGGNPVAAASPSVVQNIATTCAELNRRFGSAYRCTTSSTSGSAALDCIRSCCITCPVRTSSP
ncbi:MAG: hypothetical protein QT00_C0002G0343 [archaeon GW2011_AR5]|nr:MAG: hypothetical protein QT00_C0002G0343 [archaeon GW2011_AR5]